MVLKTYQDYQIKINKKINSIIIFLTSFFIILFLFSINTAHSIESVSGQGDNFTLESDQMTVESMPDSTNRDYSNSLPDLFDKVEKSVVQITEPGTTQATEPNPSRLGSGFVYDKSGHIVTNFHVVDGSKNNKVYVTNREFSLKIQYFKIKKINI